MDMYNKMDEYSITLDEIFILVKKSWKYILILSVLCASLFAAYKYKEDVAVYNESIALAQQDADSLLSTMSDNEKEQIKNYKALKAEVDNMKEIERDSIILSIGAYDVYTYNLQFILNNNSNVASENVLNVYQNYINCGGLTQELERELEGKYEARYLQEIISATIPGQGTDIEGQLLNVDIKGNSLEFCLEVSENIKQLLMSYQERTNAHIGENKLSLVNESAVEGYSQEIGRYKETFRAYLEDITKKEKASYDALTELQKLSIEREGNSFETNVDSVKSAGISWKYAFVGLLCGACMAIVLIIANFILSPYFNTVNEFGRIYKVNVITSITEKNIGKNESYETEVSLGAISLEKICNKTGYDSVIMCCDDVSLEETQIVEDLKKMLLEKNINCNFASNILTNSSSVSQLEKGRGIFLIEKLSKSKKKDFTNKLSRCEMYGITVLGVIVIK